MYKVRSFLGVRKRIRRQQLGRSAHHFIGCNQSQAVMVTFGARAFVAKPARHVVRQHPSAVALAGRRVAAALAYADSAAAVERAEDAIDRLRSRQLVAIEFAILTGVSAVGSAVLPAILVA